jgi:hypothetical protein
MRFFTDQYFSEEQKALIRASQPLTLQLPIKPAGRESAAGHYSGEQVVIRREAEIKEFEQTSKRIELIFLGGIVSVILAAALLDFASASHVFAA